MGLERSSPVHPVQSSWIATDISARRIKHRVVSLRIAPGCVRRTLQPRLAWMISLRIGSKFRLLRKALLRDALRTTPQSLEPCAKGRNLAPRIRRMHLFHERPNHGAENAWIVSAVVAGQVSTRWFAAPRSSAFEREFEYRTRSTSAADSQGRTRCVRASCRRYWFRLASRSPEPTR